MGLRHDEGWSMPAGQPYFATLPVHYRDAKFQFVFFRAEPDAVCEFLPEPLEPTKDGLCVASGLAVGSTSSYGAFEEAFLVLKCRFAQQTGWYCSHVLHNGPAAIAAGREIYGTPKIYAALKIEQTDEQMATVATVADRPALTVTSVTPTPCHPDTMPALTPSWRLKIIPRADAPRPAIKQLVDASGAVQNMQIHQMRKGTGAVKFDPNPRCDLTGLRPKEYLGAFSMNANYTEGFASIAYDYLEHSSQLAEDGQ